MLRNRVCRRVFLVVAVVAVVAFLVQPAVAQLPAFPGAKTQDSGADPIATGKGALTEYVFTITLDANNFSADDDLSDTAPAEFNITGLVASCGSALWTAKVHRKPLCKMQPDHIFWDLDGCDETSSQDLVVTMVTDENPGHCKKDILFFEPTSCGPLALNDGAILYDPITESPTTEPSNSLSVAACDSEVDAACESFDTDGDNDGWSYPTCGDCNDGNPDVNPGAEEICNGIDDNCDGQIDEGGVCI